MRTPLQQVNYNQKDQTLQFAPYLPYLHVDNPTNARIVLPNGQSIGPYTLNAVVSTPATQGSFIVDTSDISYPNVSIFSTAKIAMWLTNDEAPNSGTTYAPIANISNTVTVSGNVNATVTNTINAVITNANIPVTQSGTWNVTISNATLAVSQSGTWNMNISNASIAITSASTLQINIQSQSLVISVALPWAAQGTGALGAGGTFDTTAVPVGTQTLGLALIGAGSFANGLSVQGLTTFLYYETGFNFSPGGTGTGWITIPINAAADSQYRITWSGSSAIGSITAYSSALAMGYPALGPEQMAASIPVTIASDQSAVTVAPSIKPGVVFASSARANGTYWFTVPLSPGAKGIRIYTNVTAGPGTVTVTIQDMDPAGGVPYTSLNIISTLPIAALGNALLTVWPTLPAVANTIAQSIIGNRAQIQAVVAGGGATFSVGYTILF